VAHISPIGKLDRRQRLTTGRLNTRDNIERGKMRPQRPSRNARRRRMDPDLSSTPAGQVVDARQLLDRPFIADQAKLPQPLETTPLHRRPKAERDLMLSRRPPTGDPTHHLAV